MFLTINAEFVSSNNQSIPYSWFKLFGPGDVLGGLYGISYKRDESLFHITKTDGVVVQDRVGSAWAQGNSILDSWESLYNSYTIMQQLKEKRKQRIKDNG